MLRILSLESSSQLGHPADMVDIARPLSCGIELTLQTNEWHAEVTRAAGEQSKSCYKPGLSLR